MPWPAADRAGSRRAEPAPEYLLFFGSLFTTAMVNCEKWLQPGRDGGRRQRGASEQSPATRGSARQLLQRVCRGEVRPHPAAACRSPPRRGRERDGCRRRSPEGRRGCTCGRGKGSSSCLNGARRDAGLPDAPSAARAMLFRRLQPSAASAAAGRGVADAGRDCASRSRAATEGGLRTICTTPLRKRCCAAPSC